jgi:hypothetical protein
MKLICPSCFATHSIEAWVNEPDARRVIAVITRISGIVQPRVLPYLGLFRQGERGLSWKRALKLVVELQKAIEAGTIQWDRGEVRPAPPQLWAETMDAVIARRPEALDGHNYLKKAVWGNAASLAAAAERQRENERRGRIHTIEPESRGEQDGLASEAERRHVAEMLAKFTGKFKS